MLTSASQNGGHATGPATSAIYLSAESLGVLLELSAKSIYRLAKTDPTFPAVKMGEGGLRFHRGRVLRWIEQRERQQRRVRQQAHLAPKPASPQEAASAP